MRPSLARLAFLTAITSAWSSSSLAQAPVAGTTEPPRRVALLVGVNDYDKRGFDPLRWAENDVDELAAGLSQLGLDRVVVMKGSSDGELRAAKEQITRQLKNLLVGVTRNDVMMIVLGRAFAPTFREGSTAGEEMTNNLGMKLCWCPSGTFTMGSPRSELWRNHNEDQVEVTLSQGFWLGKFEVTQAEYETIVGSNPSHFKKVSGQDSQRFPVEQVSWNEAISFCALLTERERKAGRLPADWKYTLPTEAQWEYGCRAGTKSATAFGDSLSSTQANFEGNNPYNGASKGPFVARPEVVGKYPANRWGLHDMLGNVWEWCLDGYEEKLPGGKDAFVQYDEAARRVDRGGGWYNNGVNCRSALRGRNGPSYRFHDLGLRVAAVRSR